MRTEVLIAAGLVVLALAVFHPVREHEFVDLDDVPVVLENPHVVGGLTWENLRGAFLEPYYANWTPLSWISLQIDRSLFGEAAGPVLLHNALQHALAAALLFLALAQMTRAPWPSAFVAAVFAVHPLHVESVAWASERRDTLSGLLWMATLLAYAGHARRPGVGRYALVVLLFALGLLAKQVLVTLPLVLLLLDHWPLGRLREDGTSGLPQWRPARRALLEKLPLLALAAAMSAIALEAQRAGGGMRLGEDAVALAPRLENALVSYAAYLRDAFWPAGLVAYHPFPVHGHVRADVIGAAAVVAGAAGLALACWRARPAVFVGVAWFLGTLVPMIGLVQLGHIARADRYTYIPLIGLAIALAFPARDLAGRLPAARRGLALAGVLVVGALAVAASRQVAVWRDTVTLFEHAARHTENDFYAAHQLAVAYRRRGDAEQAESWYREAIRSEPRFVTAKVELASWLREQGRPQEAVPLLFDAVRLRPHRGALRALLAMTLLETGRYAEADAELRRALERGEDSARLHAALGVTAAALGREDEARRHYREALSRDPGQIGAANNLAWSLATDPDPARRDPEEALRVARAASERAPEAPDLLDTLAAAYAAGGRFEPAIDAAERALAGYEREGREAGAAATRERLALYRAGRAYVER